MSSLVFSNITATFQLVDTVGFDVFISASAELTSDARYVLSAGYAGEFGASAMSRAHINLATGGQVLVSRYADAVAAAHGEVAAGMLTTGHNVSGGSQAYDPSVYGEAIAYAFATGSTNAIARAVENQPQLVIAHAGATSSAQATTLFDVVNTVSVNAISDAFATAVGQLIADATVTVTASADASAYGEALEVVGVTSVIQAGTTTVSYGVAIDDNVNGVASAQATAAGGTNATPFTFTATVSAASAAFATALVDNASFSLTTADLQDSVSGGTFNISTTTLID